MRKSTDGSFSSQCCGFQNPRSEFLVTLKQRSGLDSRTSPSPSSPVFSSWSYELLPRLMDWRNLWISSAEGASPDPGRTGMSFRIFSKREISSAQMSVQAELPLRPSNRCCESSAGSVHSWTFDPLYTEHDKSSNPHRSGSRRTSSSLLDWSATGTSKSRVAPSHGGTCDLDFGVMPALVQPDRIASFVLTSVMVLIAQLA